MNTSKIPCRLSILLLLCLAVSLFAGCATVPRQPLTLVPGRSVETLKAEISVSVRNNGANFSGNGYLIYSRPGSFRLGFLTPFGTTAFEVFAADDTLTAVIPSRSTAYTGRFEEIPETGPLQGWRLMPWVMEDHPWREELKGQTVRQENGTARYDTEGLLAEKRSDQGDIVFYRDYQSVQGAPVPGLIEIHDRAGLEVRIKIEEPEVNDPVEKDELSADLHDLTVLPLSSFRM